MAKRTTENTVRLSDTTDEMLIEAASVVLSEYFLDPDKEDDFKATAVRLRKSPGVERAEVGEMVFEIPGRDCVVRIGALRPSTGVSVTIEQGTLNATIEGLWHFNHQELRKARVVARKGASVKLSKLADTLIETLDSADFDADEMENFADMLGSQAESPLIGDDPKQPPAPTARDRERVMVIARHLARNLEGEPSIEDQTWLEQMPQVLPVVADLAVEAACAPEDKRSDDLVQAYMILLSHQLEFVRYRVDVGWDWAIRLVDDYQQRLIALGEAQTIPREDWFAMGAALTAARIPVSEAVQTALADAGYQPREAELPEDMLATLRTFLDQLASMVSSPAEVIESLKNSSAMMPSGLRSFLTTELSLSPHAVLRDAVPMMLLDSDSAVRRDAALALAQSARPDTMSPDGLRRTITARNWVPPADRPALDAAVRKARVAGVEIGGWPSPSQAIEFHATMIDGSGAQSILAIDRSGKTGMFSGLLLKHGVGVAEAWGDTGIPKRQIVSMLRNAQMEGIFTPVGKSYVDTMVQHAIGTAVDAGRTPPEGLLTIAELIGGADWKDRKLDINQEAAALWLELPETERTAEAVQTAYKNGLTWMTRDPIIGSWFEEGPKVRQALARLPRNKKAEMAAVIIREILPATRPVWAERFVLMALWCQAALDPKVRSRAKDLIPVAYALAGDARLTSVPIMGVIAAQTVQAVLSGAW